ncbi:tyrosine-protein phosphatase [Sphingobium estronivorans]|uniref:tyrosine-protein phosphatase n=1 Tax=Sphingobium estronivorans TaxID=1577690 RepID=UPI001239352E|nr:tyrosine-protein phosphatase [Sphingobium estronivorans]
MSEPIVLTPEGCLPLESAFNLRDFGGYATADGRCVKRGMLYRSGTMALLTDADADHLRSFGIKAICDFRRPNERTAEPTLWHGAEVDYFCRDYSESSGLLGEILKRDGATASDMRETMIAMYRVIPVDHAESFSAMFARIAGGRLPLLINCSAGKDRTGVGAALVLAALGVPRATIIADYLATNDHANWDWLLAQRDTLVARARGTRADVLDPLLKADAAYLDALFATLDDAHGGIDGYLTDVLGVDAAAREAMRGMLLN